MPGRQIKVSKLILLILMVKLVHPLSDWKKEGQMLNLP